MYVYAMNFSSLVYVFISLLEYMELSQLHQFILQTDIPVNCMWCELAVNFLDKNVLQDITSEDMLVNNITSLCKQFLPNNQSMVRLLRPDKTPLTW